MSIQINLDDVLNVIETSITIRGARRRITVPKEIVDYFELKDGDKFFWILFNDDRLVLFPKKATGSTNLDTKEGV